MRVVLQVHVIKRGQLRCPGPIKPKHDGIQKRFPTRRYCGAHAVLRLVLFLGSSLVPPNPQRRPSSRHRPHVADTLQYAWATLTPFRLEQQEARRFGLYILTSLLQPHQNTTSKFNSKKLALLSITASYSSSILFWRTLVVPLKVR
jgi:hypothetical protein